MKINQIKPRSLNVRLTSGVQVKDLADCKRQITFHDYETREVVITEVAQLSYREWEAFSSNFAEDYEISKDFLSREGDDKLVGVLIYSKNTGDYVIAVPQGGTFSYGLLEEIGFTANVFRSPALGDCTGGVLSSEYDRMFLISNTGKACILENIKSVLVVEELYKRVIPLLFILLGTPCINGGNFIYIDDVAFARISTLPLFIFDKERSV